jgi:NAD(P)-dependent dehydrogenase (short-subunit alcohol dehydrogenase family)
MVKELNKRLRLEGKVAIITGAGSGMGKAAALLFVEEGAKIVAADYNPEGGKETVRLIREHGGEAVFIQADVSKASDAERMVRKAVEEYGRLDILYNNAGVCLVKPLTDTAEDEWNRMIDINLKGTFLCSKYALPEMLKVRRGSIINVGSVLGLSGSSNFSAYSAAKGGIISLTLAMAAEYAPHNIRVNCICPATIATPMTEQTVQASENPEQKRREQKRQIPLGRIGEPREVAYVALFLASEESSFITGTILPVGGGEPYCRSGR